MSVRTRRSRTGPEDRHRDWPAQAFRSLTTRLPIPAQEAIRATLADAGQDLVRMDPDQSLWQAGVTDAGITSGSFSSRFRRYLRMAGLAPTGLHVLRHTAAKVRGDAGASIEAVSAFLDHSSLAVTTVYPRWLEGEADRTWPDIALAIGD